MDRRRFLKYAGTASALTVATALGVDLITRREGTETSNATILSTTAATAVSSSTKQVTDLKIRLFEDPNGDGVQENSDALIRDPIDLFGYGNGGLLISEATIEPDSKGTYWARNVQVGGVYKIIPKTNKFRTVSLSKQNCLDVNSYSFLVNSTEPSLSLGLTCGPLTWPIPSGVSETKEYRHYVDLDPRPGYMRDWKCGDETYDGHVGTDIFVAENTTVLAACPGAVATHR